MDVCASLPGISAAGCDDPHNDDRRTWTTAGRLGPAARALYAATLAEAAIPWEVMDWRADRIGSASLGVNPTVLWEVASGYAVIGDVQFLPGYCVLLGRDPHARALADMPRLDRVQFLADADLLATAVDHACRELDPAFRRVNIDILGNADAFVHAHIWPRYEWEPPHLVGRPVWLYDLARWHDPATMLSEEHDDLRVAVTRHLRSLVDADGVKVSGG